MEEKNAALSPVS